MSVAKQLLVSIIALAFTSSAWGQEEAETIDHSGHEMGATEMDHSGHEMGVTEMDHSAHDTVPADTDHAGHDMDSGQTDQSEPAAAALSTASTPEEDLRDPHAYAEGADFGPLGRPQLADEHHFWAVLVHRLESVHTSDNSWKAFEGQIWYGHTYDRLNLKSEIEADSGEIHESRTELLWSHAIAPFWDTQLGLRHDTGEARDRSWLAFGIQGIAPYWFHVDATFYVGEHGDSAARLEAEYDMLLTQKLILQPRAEATLYGQNDDERELGSGLSALTAGLRLRYEITRQFAPYIGAEWAGLYGGTADHARAANAPTEETRWVAGVHMWF